MGGRGHIRRHLGSGAKVALALVGLPCDSERNHASHAAPRGTAGVAIFEHERRSMRTRFGSDTGFRIGLRGDLACECSPLYADAQRGCSGNRSQHRQIREGKTKKGKD